MYLESKPSDSSRDISKGPYYECRVRGSFCERSEEYDVKTINYHWANCHISHLWIGLGLTHGS